MNFRSLLPALMIASFISARSLDAYAGPKATGGGTATVSSDTVAQRERLAAQQKWLLGLAVLLAAHLRADPSQKKALVLSEAIKQEARDLGLVGGRVLAALGKHNGRQTVAVNATLLATGVRTAASIVAARRDYETLWLANLKNSCGGGGEEEDPYWKWFPEFVTATSVPFGPLPPLPSLPPLEDKPPSQATIDAINSALNASTLDDRDLSGWSFETNPSLGGGFTSSLSSSTTISSFQVGPDFSISVVADASVNAGLNNGSTWLGASTSLGLDVPFGQTGINLQIGAFVQTVGNRTGYLMQDELFANGECEGGTFVGFEFNF